MASDATLDIILRAQDKASKILDRVEGNLNDIKVAADNAGQRLSKMAGVLKTGLAVAGVAAAAAVAGVTVAAFSAIKAGSDAQESMSKFNVVFNDTAGTAERVVSELDAFAAQSGRSKYALRTMAATMGDTLKPMGFTVDEAGNLSVQMVQLAQDLGSFNNMNPEEAFERLQSTLIGNHANALAFGVIINEATLAEELAAMGADELTGALLEQAKVQARINILMRGTTDAQGDAIRTSDSWANQMIRLKSVFQDTRTEIGLALLPIFTPILTMLGDIASKYAPEAAAALAELFGQIDQEKLQENLDAFIGGLVDQELVIGTAYLDLKANSGVSWLEVGEDGTLIINEDAMAKDKLTIPGVIELDMQTAKDKEGDLYGYAINELFGGLLENNMVVLDGVIVRDRIKIGDVFESTWVKEEGGLVYFNFAGIRFNRGEGAAGKQLFEFGTASEWGFGAQFTQEDGLLYLNIAGVRASGDGTGSTMTNLAQEFVTQVNAAGERMVADVAESLDPFLTWVWPEYEEWEFPPIPDWWQNWRVPEPTWTIDIPMPGWVQSLIDALTGGGGGGGGGENGAPNSSNPGGNRNGRGGTGLPIDITTPYDTYGRASGGMVSAGAAYIVGESGSELFVPRTDGYIVNNRDMAAAAGGINVTVNASVASDMDVHRLAYQIAEIIGRRSR